MEQFKVFKSKNRHKSGGLNDSNNQKQLKLITSESCIAMQWIPHYIDLIYFEISWKGFYVSVCKNH